jgi:hypothetical protein
MPVGNVAVVPDVILWMMEKTTPDLMRNVVDLGLWDRLLPLIDDYALLRSRTQPCCVGSASDIIPESLDYSPPSTRISFDDLLEALSRETVHVGSG